jgi:hypothetical protein
MFGLNIDPNNPKGNPNPAELRELGVKKVRYTFYDSSGGTQVDQGKAQLYTDRAKAYHAAGIGSLVILTYDTYPNRPAPNGSDADWDKYIERFAQRAGQIAQLLAEWQPAFQIWNEPDHQPSGNYVPTLRESVFGRMMRRTYDAIKAVSPKAQIMTAGLAAGDPGWLTRAIQATPGGFPDDMIVAFHPYGQRPEPSWPRPDWAFGYVGNLLNGYYRAGGRHKMWITEIGIKVEDVNNDPNMAAEFLRRYYRTISTNYSDKVDQLFWFCYSDGMVPPFGLLDASGNKKPMYNTYREVTASSQPAQPEPEPAPTTPSTPSLPLPPPPTVPPSRPVSTPPRPITPTRPPDEPTSTSPATDTSRKPLVQEVDDMKTQIAGMQSQIDRVGNQMSQFQSLISGWQNQMAQIQNQLQQLSTQQGQLQSQLQQLQAQPTPTPGVPSTTSPAIPTTPSRPAPPIQNITQQLKHHPTLRYDTRPLNQIQMIVVHHTAIPPNIGADRIAAYGVDKKDWPGFKYHYFITGDGQIQQTNDLTTLSTHAGPYSPISIGVGFAGDFTNTVPPAAQFEAGARLIAWLLRQFNLSIQAVVGYKQLINTQSPGLQWDSGARWGDRLKERIQTYL